MYRSGEPMPGGAHEEEDKWKREKQEISNYIERYNISSQQLEAAYLLAMGTPEDDPDISPMLSEEVRALAKIIDQHTLAGLPLNEIANQISFRRQLETTKNDFQEWLTQLEISENERKLLRSIVEKRRMGTVTFMDKQTGKDIFEFKIPELARDSSTPTWMVNFEHFLKDAIARSTGKGIEIWFEAS